MQFSKHLPQQWVLFCKRIGGYCLEKILKEILKTLNSMDDRLKKIEKHLKRGGLDEVISEYMSNKSE
jgi:hypothetical protein